MPKESLEKYISVLGRILDKCETEYSELFPVNGKQLELFNIITDEQDDDRIRFGIKNTRGNVFYNFEGDYSLKGKKLSLRDIAKEIKKWSVHYKITPELIIQNFKESIQEPLGKHLAEKELANLEKELLS